MSSQFFDPSSALFHNSNQDADPPRLTTVPPLDCLWRLVQLPRKSPRLLRRNVFFDVRSWVCRSIGIFINILLTKNLPLTPSPTRTTPAATPPTAIVARPPFQSPVQTPPPPWMDEDADSTNYLDCPESFFSTILLNGTPPSPSAYKSRWSLQHSPTVGWDKSIVPRYLRE